MKKKITSTNIQAKALKTLSNGAEPLNYRKYNFFNEQYKKELYKNIIIIIITHLLSAIIYLVSRCTPTKSVIHKYLDKTIKSMKVTGLAFLINSFIH